MACWRSRLMIDCAVFPGVAMAVDWGDLDAADTKAIEDDPIRVNATLSWPESLNVSVRPHGFAVDHANLHACRTTAGFCSPFVEMQPQLVTHSTEMRSNTGRVVIDSRLGFAEVWMYIVHFRLFVEDGIRIDFAKGTI
eukprot:450263-Prymnesium_polylepis.1